MAPFYDTLSSNDRSTVFSSPLALRCTNTPSSRSSLPDSGYLSLWKFPAPPSPPMTPPNDIDMSPCNSSPLQFLPTRSESSTQPRRRTFPVCHDTRLQRRTSPNALLRIEEQRRARRRDAFLSKVQGQRETRSWDARGDQILHFDYTTQRKAWEEERAREAPNVDPDTVISSLEEEQLQSPHHQSATSLQSPSSVYEPMDMNCGPTPLTDGQRQYQGNELLPDEDEVAALFASEAQELEALIATHDAIMEDKGRHERTEQVVDEKQASSPRYGSDDEEFEELLMTLEWQENAMDMSGD